MNKNLVIGIIVVLVLLAGYFVISGQQTPQAPVPAPVEKETATLTEITVALSEQNASGESGSATLMEVDGKVKVTLTMTGAPSGVTQPAHIHVGACPDVGAVKYPLTSPVDGVSETMLDVTLAQLKSELPLGINVHKSADEATVYVSCGDIKL